MVAWDKRVTSECHELAVNEFGALGCTWDKQTSHWAQPYNTRRSYGTGLVRKVLNKLIRQISHSVPNPNSCRYYGDVGQSWTVGFVFTANIEVLYANRGGGVTTRNGTILSPKW